MTMGGGVNEDCGSQVAQGAAWGAEMDFWSERIGVESAFVWECALHSQQEKNLGIVLSKPSYIVAVRMRE